MQWNNDTQSYRGTTSDGKTIDVAGEEYAESLADGAGEEVLNDPDMWAPLVGDNQNVTCLEENEAIYREGRY